MFCLWLLLLLLATATINMEHHCKMAGVVQNKCHYRRQRSFLKLVKSSVVNSMFVWVSLHFVFILNCIIEVDLVRGMNWEDVEFNP